MKKLLLLVFITHCFIVMNKCFSQAPNAISYQGVARNAAGNILASQNIALRISIHDGTASGTVVFIETHATTTTALGVFSINIGSGTTVNGTLADVNWGGGAKFIQVEMDAAGGTVYTDMGTTQLNSVPYALFAGSSGSLPDGTANGNTLRWNGTAWVADTTVTNTGTNAGVGTATPVASAALEVRSNTKGFLMPRMTTAQRDAIASPAVGLQIFNLDDKCTDLYDGNNWIKTCGLKVTGTYNIPIGNSWAQKANFGVNGPRYPIGFSIGNKGYIGGSIAIDQLPEVGVLWEYDPASNIWSQKAGCLSSWLTIGFSIENKGYVVDGITFKEYDPATNTWTQKANVNWGIRPYPVAFSIGTKGYYGTGGYPPSYNDFYEYDPANDTWTQKANVGGGARTGAVGFSIGNKGYIGTGWTSSPGALNYDFWEYEPVANTWIQKTNFPGVGNPGRWQAVGFAIGNKGYLGTGNMIGGPSCSLKDFWEYNPTLNTWTQKANLGGVTGRLRAVGFSIGNKGYIGGGFLSCIDANYVNFGTPANDFWEYMEDNIIGNAYSSNAVSTSVNTVSDGAWTLANGTVYNSNTGNVGIGTTAPTAKLDIAGKIKIVDGTQAVNRVLTSDANGLASWATGGTVTSVAALTIGTTGTDVNSTVANGTTTPVITLHVPDAGAAARGVVTTGAQTFAGTKTFTGGLTTTGTGAITSGGGGIGYATGAGGTITQITSRATAVTLNKLCGTITMFSAAQASQAVVSFTLTNSFIAATDVILVQHISATNAGAWQFSVVPAAGSCVIYVRNVTAASITEATPLRFTILKAVTN